MGILLATQSPAPTFSEVAMSVTAALIVANEERTLGRCLDSIKDSVDEIVVVDTGSRDHTKDIARQYTKRVYDFVWRRDFAAAREFSFDHSPTDWVFWVDADDVVENAHRIRDELEDVRHGVKGFHWKYIYARDECGNTTCELWRERCVRNDHTFHWVGRVHEVLVPSQPARLERSHHVLVVHRPDPTRRRHPWRNLNLLREEIAHHLDPPPRLLLYLGYEYRDLGHWGQARYYLERYVHWSTWDEEKYLAEIEIAKIYRREGEYRAAVETGLRALKILPQWPHAYFSLGETYYFLQDWPKVIEWIELGRRLPIPETLCILNPMDLRYYWIIFYAIALYHVGRIEDAVEWTEAALKICPGADWHVENDRFFREILSSRDRGRDAS
jgi:glycosyltransferase involved in cell wall biosynthesis